MDKKLTAEEATLKLKRGAVVYMKGSSGLIGYGNPQCVSWYSPALGELSLFGHNEHYHDYDVDRIVEDFTSQKLAATPSEETPVKEKGCIPKSEVERLINVTIAETAAGCLEFFEKDTEIKDKAGNTLPDACIHQISNPVKITERIYPRLEKHGITISIDQKAQVSDTTDDSSSNADDQIREETPDAEAILDKHLAELHKSHPDQYYSIEEAKKQPEYGLIIAAMKEYAKK